MPDVPQSSVNNFSSAALVPGNTYTFTSYGGRYSVIRKATGFGAGIGISVSVKAPDGTWMQYANWTANGASEVFLPSGSLRVTAAADLNAGQISLTRMG